MSCYNRINIGASVGSEVCLLDQSIVLDLGPHFSLFSQLLLLTDLSLVHNKRKALMHHKGKAYGSKVLNWHTSILFPLAVKFISKD